MLATPVLVRSLLQMKEINLLAHGLMLVVIVLGATVQHYPLKLMLLVIALIGIQLIPIVKDLLQIIMM